MTSSAKSSSAEEFQIVVNDDRFEITPNNLQNRRRGKEPEEPLIIHFFDKEKLDEFNAISVKYITKDMSSKDLLKIMRKLLNQQDV